MISAAEKMEVLNTDDETAANEYKRWTMYKGMCKLMI